jgi:PQQ-dependent dehydrogenase (methanol/ethanol family)
VVNRGVAVWKGAVYVGTLDGRLVSIDAATGKKNWETLTIDRSRPYTITGAPRIVKDKVVIGNGGAELGVRGYVTAYDAGTGKQAWRFFIVPGDPSKPFEHPEMEAAAKTWTGEWWKVGGGGTAWDSMAYDPELDLLYVGTGNGAPWTRVARSPGGGDNLYLSSILAIRPDTGELAWHYQTTPGDNWDYTAVQHMILADLEIGGKPRKVIMQAPKNGFFYVLDRATGELLSAEKYVATNWASKVDLATGRPVETAQSDYAEDPKLIPCRSVRVPGSSTSPPRTSSSGTRRARSLSTARSSGTSRSTSARSRTRAISRRQRAPAS